MKKLTATEKQAFDLLKTLEKKRDEYWEINRLLRKQSDFMGLEHCNSDIEGGLVLLLDTIFGNELDGAGTGLASYYLYEKPSGGGCITIYGKDGDYDSWNIRNIKDLIKYYRETK